MSAIYVHTLYDEPLTVEGSERSYAAMTATDTTVKALGADIVGGVLSLTQKGIIPRDALDFTALGNRTPLEALHMWLSDPLGMSEVTIKGEPTPVTHAVLNTATVAGPDPIAFLARLHGSIDNRLWVAAADTAWLASVLREGHVSGVLREGLGWEAVTARLSTTSSPAVISTSAGLEFPNVEYSEETGEIIVPDDPHAAWLASYDEVTAQGWWQQLSPSNLRSPAYAPLTTFQDALTEKDPWLAAALRRAAR